MKKTIQRILNLLSSSEHDIESLKLKLNIPSEQVKVLLDWGEVNKLWIKDPASQLYRIADTGELLLEDPGQIDNLINANPLELPKIEDRVSPLLKDSKLLCRIRRGYG